MRRIAIIPARGGSRRLPRKNVLPFMGKPMIAHTILAAIESDLFDHVVVSTEDSEIADVARDLRAHLSHRRPELAGDHATVVDVCIDVLDEEMRAGRNYDVMSCLYATAPLRGAADIAATVSLVQPGRCDFAMAVTDYSHPPHQALLLRDDGRLEPMWPELVKSNGPNSPVLVDNGSTYAATASAFLAHRTFYGPGLRGHQMPRSRSVDLNEAEDLELLTFYAGQRTVRA